MKKRIKTVIIIVIIGLLIYWWYDSNKVLISKLTNPNSTAIITPTPALASGWQDVTPEKEQVAKYVKEIKSGFQPTIVVLSSVQDISDPKVYTDNLVKGATSALPSLKITQDDTTQKDSLYTRTLVGFYYNKKTKINIKQNLIIKNNQIITIAASTTTEDLEPAFTQITTRQLQSL